MQKAFELLRPRCYGARKRRIEYLTHLATVRIDGVCNEPASLVDRCQWRYGGLIKLLHLLGDLVDGLKGGSDIVLNRTEDRVKHTQELPMRQLRQSKT